MRAALRSKISRDAIKISRDAQSSRELLVPHGLLDSVLRTMAENLLRFFIVSSLYP
jgi:hypothetical protein